MDWLAQWAPVLASVPGWITMVVLGTRYLGHKWQKVKNAERDARLRAEAALLKSEKQAAILQEQVDYLKAQLYGRPTAEGGG